METSSEMLAIEAELQDEIPDIPKNSLINFHIKFFRTGKIGIGGFGQVWRIQKIADMQTYAAKYIEKKRISKWKKTGEHSIPLELEILQKCQKIPGVIQIEDWFFDDVYFVIVLELPDGFRDILKLLHKFGPFAEEKCKKIFKNILNCVYDIMQCGVFHRDIKLENILVNVFTNEIKIIDFGCATYSNGQQRFYELIGTPHCQPSELHLDQGYTNESCTVFSLGVLLYEMLTSKLAFSSLHEIIEGYIPYFDDDLWKNKSVYVKNLIISCLECDKFKRISVKKMIEHKWFK